MCRWILILPPLQKLKELLCPSLLKETHERTLDSFHLSARDLGDLTVPINKASSDLLELEVSGDIGVDEDLGQLSRCNNELWNQINCVVAVPAKLSGRALVWPKLAVQLGVVGEDVSTVH